MAMEIFHLAQTFDRLDDAFDLVGAFLVFAAEVLGELCGGGEDEGALCGRIE